MIAAIERFATAGMLRFRLRSRAAMARTMRLTGAAVAAFVVALAVFPDTVPILAPPLRKVRRHGQRCRLGSANRSRGAVREGRPPPGRVSRPDDH